MGITFNSKEVSAASCSLPGRGSAVEEPKLEHARGADCPRVAAASGWSRATTVPFCLPYHTLLPVLVVLVLGCRTRWRWWGIIDTLGHWND